MRLTALAVLVASAAAIHAQPPPVARPSGGTEISQPAGPPRDCQLEATGSGVVRGVVIDAGNGQPVRRAEVWVTMMSPGAARATTRATVADTEGRFEFTDLPPGVVTLRATKNSYYNEDEAHGGDGPAPPRPPRPTLAAGQTLDGQTVRLRRGGAIVGQLVDEFGEPVEGVGIEVLRRVPTGDGPRWTAVGRGVFRNGQTDDTGAFRVWSLPPGQYVVAARVGPMLDLRPGQCRPVARGSRLLTSRAPRGSARHGSSRWRPAGESAPVVFALATAPLATIRGTVAGVNGQRLDNASLMVGRIDNDRLDGGASSTNVADDGTFEVARLPPGRYRLSATDYEPVPARRGPGAMRGTRSPKWTSTVSTSKA